MNYFTYNLFFSLMTILPVVIWFVVSLLVILDADRMPKEAWDLSGESKNVWLAISILLAWPFGLIVYIFTARRKVAEITKGINEEALIAKAANRIRKESAAAAAPAGSPAPHLQRVTVVEVPRNEVFEAEAPATPEAPKSNDEAVFDYEESRPADEDQESVATTAAPVIPPKPTRAPRVGAPEVENK